MGACVRSEGQLGATLINLFPYSHNNISILIYLIGPGSRDLWPVVSIELVMDGLAGAIPGFGGRHEDDVRVGNIMIA
jgi:hypothetical protein